RIARCTRLGFAEMQHVAVGCGDAVDTLAGLLGLLDQPVEPRPALPLLPPQPGCRQLGCEHVHQLFLYHLQCPRRGAARFEHLQVGVCRFLPSSHAARSPFSPSGAALFTLMTISPAFVMVTLSTSAPPAATPRSAREMSRCRKGSGGRSAVRGILLLPVRARIPHLALKSNAVTISGRRRIPGRPHNGFPIGPRG